jgi:fibronectin type 3 domain-containing protein
VSSATNSPTVQTFTGTGTLPPNVALTWTDGGQVAGYNVYRGTTSGGPYPNKLNSSLVPQTNFTDTTVQSGSTYYYVTTAVNSGGQESAYSDQASASVP